MKYIIKRYRNRKLYDPNLGRYVKLSELADMVREGKDFIVECNFTKKDITSNALSTIILQENLTPVDELKRVIKSFDPMEVS